MTGPWITALGHAGLRVAGTAVTVLCDPWMSPGGAFLGSWFPFPDNSHLRTPAVLDADWVVVSHEHLDHMDLALLAGLRPATRVVVPRYPSTVLVDRLRGAGVRNVVQLGAWERLALDADGDWLTVIPEQSPMCHDAAVLLAVDGRAVMHTNDARLSVAQARRAEAEVGGRLDAVFLQMSGASWHPICYEYPAEVVDRISAEKRRGKFRAVTRLLRAVPPRIALPYAGPPCFLDPALQRHNAWMAPPGIFPDQEQAQAALVERLPGQLTDVLLPGDVLDVGSGDVARDPRWEGFRGGGPERAHYLDAYAERRSAEVDAVWAGHPDPAAGDGLAERFADHFARLGELSGYFRERISMRVRFEVEGADGGRWDVDIAPDRVRVDLCGRSADPHYRFRVAARWLAPVLDGRLRWEDLLLSLRFSAWREPDVYNDYLVGLLKHADADALHAVEAYETRRDPHDLVAVTDGARTWEVSRFCPHAGEDLAHGSVIRDGVLRCLGHNFDFDLADGRCLSARCDPLVVRPAKVLTTPG